MAEDVEDPGADVEPTSRRWPTGRARVEGAVIVAACGLYLVFLLRLLLFSRSVGSGRSLNLVPFASISLYLGGGSGRAAFGNVVGNVLAFVPFGAYLGYLRRRSPFWADLLVVVGVSVVVEVLQGVLAIGASDVDDVVLNSLGGAAGLGALRLAASVLTTHPRVRTAVAVFSVLVGAVTCYLLVVVRLRL